MRPGSIAPFFALIVLFGAPWIAPELRLAAQAVNGEIVGDEPPPVLVEPEPADGKWLRDAEGREYMEMRTPVAHAQKISGTEIRTMFGLTLDLIRMEGNEFIYKYYRPLPRTTPKKKDLNEENELLDKFYRSAFEDSTILTATPFDRGLPKAGQWRDGFDLADMNEDGHIDLVFGPPRKSMRGPVIYLGNGKGDWEAWKEAQYPSLKYDYGTVAAADLNGDRHLDLVFGVHLRGLLAMHGDGKGTFVAAGKGLEFAMPGSGEAEAFSSKAIAIEDWNRDGHPDIVALGEGPRLNLTGENKGLSDNSFGVVAYLNDGDGGWKRTVVGAAARKNFGNSIVVKDLDRDRSLDIITSSASLGRRDIVHFGDGGTDGQDAEIAELRPNLLVRDVDTADIDRNGLEDIVVAYASFEGETWRSAADVLLQLPKRRWSRQVLMSVKGLDGPNSVAIGEVTGDGRADIFVGTQDGEVWPFVSNVEQGFTRDRLIASGFAKCRVAALAARDLDRDSRADLIAIFADETNDEAKPCPTAGGIAVWNFADKAVR